MSATMKSCASIENLDVAKRLSENLELIREAGFEVYASREYPSVKEGGRILAKYNCRFGDWEIVIRDILSPFDQGTLKIQQIECLSTGRTYRTYCNLRGKTLDRNRLKRIKKLLVEGRTNHFDFVARFMLQLNTLLEDNYSVVKTSFDDFSFLEDGEIIASDGLNEVYIRLGEDTMGNASIIVSNGANWSNPYQSTDRVVGEIFPLENAHVVVVYNYIKKLFEDTRDNKRFPLPLELYKEGYNWMME